MESYLKIAGIVIGGIAGLYLLYFSMVLARLLKNPFWLSHYQPVNEPPALSLAQQAAIGELGALGFVPAQWYTLTYADQSAFVLALLREDRCVALLDFRATLSTGYQCGFYSVTTQQQLLCTLDRMGCMAPDFPDRFIVGRCGNDSLQTQWLAHQQLMDAHTLQCLDANGITTKVMDPLRQVFSHWEAKGVLKREGDHYFMRLSAAVALTAKMLKNQRQLSKPPSLLPSRTEHLPALFADSYCTQEFFENNQVPRRRVQALLLLVTLVVSWVGWGALFDWGTALILIVVILVHELGHALVMRCFGYRDVNMFFVPFLGALVTGRGTAISTFKQTLILLAGPVPGIILGLALLATGLQTPLPLDLTVRKIGELFVIINAFNLLPVPPLDGGKIIEMALFSRWPKSRFAFNALALVLSLLAALWLKQPLLFVLAFFMFYSVRTQWRIAQMAAQCPASQNGSESEQVAQIFDYSHRQFGPRPLMLHYREIKMLMQVQRIQTARKVEAVFGVSVVIVCLLGTSIGLAHWNSAPRMRIPDSSLSVEQQAFHRALFDYEQVQDESFDDVEAALETLRRATDALSSDDLRRVDFEVMTAQSLSGMERITRLETLLTAGTSGLQYDASNIAYEYLWYRRTDETRRSAADRRDFLAAGIATVEKYLPEDYAVTITTRLALAEAIDDAGDSLQALAMLDTIHDQAKIREQCRCHLGDIIYAKTWYFLSHSRVADARKTLIESAYADKITEPRSDAAFAYAWILLEEGDHAEAATQMLLSETIERKKTLRQFVGLEDTPLPWYAHRLDVIYAMAKNFQWEEANTLIEKNYEVSFYCFAGDEGYRRFEEPWQKMRHQRFAEIKATVCQRASPLQHAMAEVAN
ncbi:Hypothetical protein HDN1F_27330 [gamma proteobacterium HdN1]|nr:Hypothetical protein HDN1F_27330 [gamma proteobacterium HdN1]